MCGLSPGTDGTLAATFWTWEWDTADQPIDVRPLLPELNAVDAMLDCPQGLADSPERMRVCERKVGAAGKTSCERPRDTSRPFAGFVLSGLELFDALHREGLRLASSKNMAGRVGEVYPGDLWPRLAKPGLPAGRVLPKKTSRQGRMIRKALLSAAGVRFGSSLEDVNHDQLDACLGALVAAARRHKVPGIKTCAVGKPITRDSGGDLREGEMYQLEVTGDQVLNDIKAALHPLHENLVAVAPGHHPARSRHAAGHRSAITNANAWSALEWIRSHHTREPAQRAAALLSWLLRAAGPGGAGPVLLGYGAAWKLVLPKSPYPTRQGAIAWRDVIQIAKASPQQALPAFGAVRLDTFLVAESKSRVPGRGHWKAAQYAKEDWLRVFGESLLIRAKDVPG